MDVDPNFSIGFVGAGRVGTGLAWGLARRGYRVAGVASRSQASAQRLAAAIPRCAVHGDTQALADAVELVFLTVPDDAIAAACARVVWRKGQSVVHCSGATELDALAAAAAGGAQVGGFHPLQMFTDPETALRGLPGCAIAIEAAPPLGDRLAAMAQALGCQTLRLPSGTRALYHAGAGYVAGFVNALAREASRIWGALGLTEEEALRALLPLLRGSADSIERLGPARGMAGPISRGDLGTVERHLAALAPLGGDTLELYRALALRTVALAIERGSLGPEQAARLRALLKG
ncbi:MAG: DUF2520 domain-containing protein [Betaproteobacteria bacterium]|nr:DUF2520 domain-containing protein [Betaproteobacteria bacterium]